MTSSESSARDNFATVRIDGFTHGGEGVARVNGKATFVADTIPGELVRITIIDEKKRWARARAVEIVETSPDRVTPPCTYADQCGGCDLQHITPQRQRQLKTRVVREQLERLGGLTDPPVAECRAVGPDVGYRNHAQFQVADDGRLGFHRAGSHQVVPIDHCLILTPAVQRLADQLDGASGAIKIGVRAHATTDTSAIVLSPGPGGLEFPDVESDLVLEQPDGRGLTIRGAGVLREIVHDATYQFGATAFFQVNAGGAAALVDEVRAAIGPIQGDIVWDLYAGVGLFAVALAADGADVIAVESDAGAASDAEANAAANGVMFDVVHDDVAAVVARAASGDRTLDLPDVVVLDPPRTGAGTEVIDNLASIAPGRIVYVACDVAALARDAKALTAHGYKLLSAVPLDLFPMTHHVEVVATFAP